jgi:hypothetical protein
MVNVTKNKQILHPATKSRTNCCGRVYRPKDFLRSLNIKFSDQAGRKDRNSRTGEMNVIRWLYRIDAQSPRLDHKSRATSDRYRGFYEDLGLKYRVYSTIFIVKVKSSI